MQRFGKSSRLCASALLAAGVLPATTAVAQRVPATALRYELGARLRALENALENARGRPDVIERAMPLVDESVRAFFGLQLARAAERLDAARFALTTAAEVERSHARLAFVPAMRLVDPAVSRELAVEHAWVYAPGRDAQRRFGPEELRYRIGHRLLDAAGVAVAGPSERICDDLAPATMSVSVPRDVRDADLTLASTITPIDSRGSPVASAPAITRRCTVSVVRDAEARRAALASIEQRARAAGLPTAAATVSHYARMLRALAKGRTLETDVPAASLLAEAEAIGRHLEAENGAMSAYFAAPRSGERWIHLAVPDSDDDPDDEPDDEPSLVPLRLWTPADVPAGTRIPLVIALHGAGGSENMFFDGYGDGLARRLAAERGWAFVAPRTQTPSRALVAMVDELARRYPIDTDDVLLLGHSMGAAKAVELLQAAPGRFAAAAPMGGGGRVRAFAAFDELPMFIGCGERDFALRGARALHERSERAGARATLRLYPGIEHLTIVQIALPDVYAFFDAVVGR